MSSTFSSSDRQVSGQSPTEALAARYRHLFVLPSRAVLVILNAVVAVVLSVAAAKGTPSATVAGVSLVAALLIPLVVARVAQAIDSTTIATFRRSLAATFAGTLLWLLCAGVGLAYASASGSGRAVGNSLVFGAFICGGFETLIINGAFLEQTPISAVLGILQPAITAATMMLVGGIGYSGYALVLGVAAFALIVLFNASLKRKETSKGHNSVKLFQAFMKTWANKDASQLESIIKSHAEQAEVASKVMRFQSAGGDLFFVLPGIHPGPFYPVGSYNLPGLVSQAFEGSGRVLTLHRPGGHERNLATNADAREYAQRLRDFAVALGPAKPTGLRGPTEEKVGKATAALCGFGDELLLTVSFAPYGSDDLELDFERELAAAASKEGFDINIVDAHNSIDNERTSSAPNDPQWRRLMQAVKRADPSEFRIGYAHSQEDELPSSGDLTANGIGLVVLEVRKAKWVLALADANNSVPNLRSVVSTALESSGFKLLEFCTSDSHDLAARGLTVNRGYKALGEATPADVIAQCTVALARKAESQLSKCDFAAGTMTSRADLFGASALGEFATITREGSRFSKRYAQFGAAGLVAMLLLSLVL